MTPSRIGVVGASARAAVHSLARAGYSAWAIDLFADRDLKRLAPCAICPIDQFPTAIPELASRFSAGPFILTGGMENHPSVVAALSAHRELRGTPAETMSRVRDPFQLAKSLGIEGFAHPAVTEVHNPTPGFAGAGARLRKPLRSSGGHGIRFELPDDPASPHHYLQEFIPGPAMSAVYREARSHCELFGVTEQLIGTDWLHAGPFQYAGNIALAVIEPQLRNELIRIGQHLVAARGLRGVFGVDFILKDERPWVIEVNPRYPASVEVIEHATGTAVFSDQRAAIQPRLMTVGKAIYYTPRRMMFPASGPWNDELVEPFDLWRLPAFADIPEPGSAIEAGWPVLTILDRGSSPTECRQRLQSRAEKLDRLFAGTGS